MPLTLSWWLPRKNKCPSPSQWWITVILQIPLTGVRPHTQLGLSDPRLNTSNQWQPGVIPESISESVILLLFQIWPFSSSPKWPIPREVKAILWAFKVNPLTCFRILCHTWCHLNVYYSASSYWEEARQADRMWLRRKGRKDEEREGGKTKPRWKSYNV